MIGIQLSSIEKDFFFLLPADLNDDSPVTEVRREERIKSSGTKDLLNFKQQIQLSELFFNGYYQVIQQVFGFRHSFPFLFFPISLTHSPEAHDGRRDDEDDEEYVELQRAPGQRGVQVAHAPVRLVAHAHLKQDLQREKEESQL